MSQQGRIVDYLGNDLYVVKLPPEEESDLNPSIDAVTVAHDYVMFTGDCSFMMEQKDGKYPYKPKRGASNWRSSRASVQIGIREMYDIILPFLAQHPYLQQDHIKDREHSDDDKYYEQYGLKEPRYKKGDKYPAYAYSGGIVKYYDNGQSMVAFRRTGEVAWNKVTLDCLIKLKEHYNLV